MLLHNLKLCKIQETGVQIEGPLVEHLRQGSGFIELL